MTNQENIQLFEEQAIRSAWNENEEEWYFSIVDVVAALTESKDPTAYWRKLKHRLTDVANTEQLLRIIQSIPSKKAKRLHKRMDKPAHQR